MTRRIALLVGACALALSAQESKPETKPAEVKLLNEDEIVEAVKQNKYVLLDVREPKELSELGTFEGYVNIPLGELEKRLSELPKDKVILTVCNRGARAGKAADILLQNGFQVYARCGIKDWKDTRLTLVYPPAK